MSTTAISERSKAIRLACNESPIQYIDALLILRDMERSYRGTRITLHLNSVEVESLFIAIPELIKELYKSSLVKMPFWFQKTYFPDELYTSESYLGDFLNQISAPWFEDEGRKLLIYLDSAMARGGPGIETAFECAQILLSYEKIVEAFANAKVEVPEWFRTKYEPKTVIVSCEFCKVEEPLMPDTKLCKKCYIKRRTPPPLVDAPRCQYVYQYNGRNYKIGDQCSRPPVAVGEKFCSKCVCKIILYRWR